MKVGKKKVGDSHQSQSDDTAVYGGFEEMPPVSDAAAAVEEYRQQQQQRQRKLDKGKEVQQDENEDDFEEEEEDGDYYEDGEEEGMYDRFNHQEIDQNGDFQADYADGEGDGDGDDERPKLAEGFYEIEAVRKKRTRKGVAQYLIKWRGWPETANTWEPLVNLQSCSDVIEAFEERLQSSGKGKPGRRRKRKVGVTPQTQSSKKKAQQPQSQQRKQQSSPTAATYSVPSVRLRLIEDPLPFSPMINSLNAVENDGGPENAGETPKQGDENRTVLTSPRNEGKGDINMSNKSLSEPNRGSRFMNLENPTDVSLYAQEHPASEMNGVPSVNGNEASQNGRRIGARRRKSGAVKRFKPESTSQSVDNAQDATIKSFTNGIPDDYMGSNKFDSPTSAITQIIKAIDYSASPSNNKQDVSVTFKAMRADGKEVTVNNKFLKAHFPLLLINFYEQNLRYTPTE